MITYKCPTCGAEITMAVYGDLVKGLKITCLKCGGRLVLCLVVCNEEQILKKLFSKKEKVRKKNVD